MANTGKIERAAVRAVEEYLDKCPKLEPGISKADKNIIWDGVINIFEKEGQKISQFFAQVPLQVKGTGSTKDINSFRLGRDYIKGYKKVGGTAFFLVQKGKGKVFYALLSVEDIDKLLQQNTKTIKIDLQEVPTAPLDFQKKLYTFAANRNNEKVENTSPKEIQELVEGFEEIRGHLEKIENKEAKIELGGLLDIIKSLKVDDTVGWRDKFYFFSRKAINLAINNIEGYDFAELQFQLGKYLHKQKQYHLAEDYYLKSLEKYRKSSDLANTAIALNKLAILYWNLTRYDEAEKEYKEALKIRRELAKTNRNAYIKYVADTFNNLGLLHDDLTRYEEAEKEYKEALKIYRELAKTNRDAYIGSVATTLNNLGNLHDDLNRKDEAEKEYNEALEIRRELAITNRDAYIYYVSRTLNNLAVMHKDLTRYDEAEKEYKEALEIYRKLVKTNRDAFIADVGMTLNNMGELHKNLSRYDEAENEYEEALKIRRELAETNRDAYSWYLANTLNNLGELYQALGRHEEAESYYKEALKIRRELVRVNREANIKYLAETLYNYASLLQEAINRKAEAKKAAEEALGIYKELAKAYPQIWNRYVEKTERLLKDLSD